MSENVYSQASLTEKGQDVLSRETIAFVAELQRHFGSRRRELLEERRQLQSKIARGVLPEMLVPPRIARDGKWRVLPAPEDLLDRRVEITGPTDRKMVINALNSGASTFMADFEDANTPTWENMVEGQANLIEAVAGTIEMKQNGQRYTLNDNVATLIVRPRGWHLDEPHVMVDGEPVSGSLFDFGVFIFHNHKALAARGSAPYFYLPKLQGHREARLWNDVFIYAQDVLGMDVGTIKATVLIEHILAALDMDAILYELRHHSAGLNAGRWDYIFSIIKTFRNDARYMLPDRSQVTMTTPFMRAYTDRLVATCHRRGAYAIGGMAAFIPNRRDPELNERALANVRADKEREAADGFDGTWVAHPDLIATALDAFDARLGARHNQLEQLRPDVDIDEPTPILSVAVPDASITEKGVRTNISVAILYLESWLRGRGAAALFNLMEDAATAEISRSQIWQWLRHGATIDDGRTVTHQLVEDLIAEEVDRIQGLVGDEAFAAGRFNDAIDVFRRVATTESFPEFLTTVAYEYL